MSSLRGASAGGKPASVVLPDGGRPSLTQLPLAPGAAAGQALLAQIRAGGKNAGNIDYELTELHLKPVEEVNALAELLPLLDRRDSRFLVFRINNMARTFNPRQVDVLWNRFYESRLRGRTLDDLSPSEITTAYVLASSSSQRGSGLDRWLRTSDDNALSSSILRMLDFINETSYSDIYGARGAEVNAVDFLSARIRNQENLSDLGVDMHRKIAERHALFLETRPQVRTDSGEKDEGSPPPVAGEFRALAKVVSKIEDPGLRIRFCNTIMSHAVELGRSNSASALRACSEIIMSGHHHHPPIADSDLLKFAESCLPHYMEFEHHYDRVGPACFSVFAAVASRIEDTATFARLIEEISGFPSGNKPLFGILAHSDIDSEMRLGALSLIGRNVKDPLKRAVVVENLGCFLSTPSIIYRRRLDGKKHEYVRVNVPARAVALDVLDTLLDFPLDEAAAAEVVHSLAQARRHPIAAASNAASRALGLVASHLSDSVKASESHGRVSPPWIPETVAYVGHVLSEKPNVSDEDRVRAIELMSSFLNGRNVDRSSLTRWIERAGSGIKSPGQRGRALLAVGRSIEEILIENFIGPIANMARKLPVEQADPVLREIVLANSYGIYTAATLASVCGSDQLRAELITGFAERIGKDHIAPRIGVEAVKKLSDAISSDSQKGQVLETAVGIWRGYNYEPNEMLSIVMDVGRKTENLGDNLRGVYALLDNLQSREVSRTLAILNAAEQSLMGAEDMEIPLDRKRLGVMVEYMAHPDSIVRQTVCHIFSRIRPNIRREDRWTAAEALAANLSHPVREVREMAALNINAIGGSLGREDDARHLIEKSSVVLTDKARVDHARHLLKTVNASLVPGVLDCCVSLASDMTDDQGRLSIMSMIGSNTLLSSFSEVVRFSSTASTLRTFADSQALEARMRIFGMLRAVQPVLASSIISEERRKTMEWMDFLRTVALRSNQRGFIPGTRHCGVMLDMPGVVIDGQEGLAFFNPEAYAQAVSIGVARVEDGQHRWPIKEMGWEEHTGHSHGRNIFNESWPEAGKVETYPYSIKASGTYKGTEGVPYAWHSGSERIVHRFWGGGWRNITAVEVRRALQLRAAYAKAVENDSVMQRAEREFGVNVDMFIEPVAVAKPLEVPVYKGEGVSLGLMGGNVQLMEHAAGLKLAGIPPEAVKEHREYMYRDPLAERNEDLRDIKESDYGWNKIFHYYGYLIEHVPGQLPNVRRRSDGTAVDYYEAAERVYLGAAARYGIKNRVIHHYLGGALTTGGGSVYQSDGHNVNPLCSKDYDTVWTVEDYDNYTRQGSLGRHGSKDETIRYYQEDDNTRALKQLEDLAKKLSLTEKVGLIKRGTEIFRRCCNEYADVILSFTPDELGI